MDAYRIASHHLWDAVVQIATARTDIGRDVLINTTKRIWHLQDAYTDAMTDAYRQQIAHQVLEDEAERAALTEALLDGRTLSDYAVWEVAQLLRLPISGPYVVIAATCPTVGKQALPGIAAKLRSADIFSAWRLLPDFQVGIAHVSTQSKRDTVIELLLNQFDDLSDDEKGLLFQTFRIWLANKGSAVNAAAQLYCHPNTVRHLLRRIEERTGCSLAVPDELAELCLAFEIRQNLPEA